MVRCIQCGKAIESGEKIVVQYDGIMTYEKKEAHPTHSGSFTKYWHKKCKPWHE
jgi:hypothetical protein